MTSPAIAPPKRRILFVDDEAGVLDGLRNVLRKHRSRWDMVFATSGAAALEELERGRFDVVVSDMRMPAMDGATLLAAIRDRDPSVTRIILSGHADRELVMKALPVAHQYLGKPCDAEVLRTVIERACDLHALVGDPAIRAVVGGLDHVPSPPRSYERLVALLRSPEASLGAIADLVEEDLALGAKILQIVNSAYFGLPRRMSSIRDAIGYLGLDVLGSLALSANLLAQATTARGLSLDDLNADAITTARLAASFAGKRPARDDAFAAGLLHDIGQVALAVGMTDRYADLLAEARAARTPIEVVERAHLGVTHAEVGAYLLGVWGVPIAIVEAVARHHDPSPVTDVAGGVVPFVHVAQALADGREPDVDFLARVGLADELARWREEAR